ncbi:TonB-dependent receptor domain-containing protein [Sphingomonas japonica]|uniref:Outer membrane receptor protein involved in Fe transport n=1 Tax=Sphingomonas japonica TaxID=511662 RepID=A0ABX0U3M4_9SPHN|nr:TonB-dependent receptor [Sphingomonas japonica]NIJ25089.1 outer membrane receptor protein involved in Fe transport [Sphingomonas japonica]
MKKSLAFASLLMGTTVFVAPAALAQTTTPPASSTVSPDAGGDTPVDQVSPTEDPVTEQEVEVSAPGAGDDYGEDIVVIGRNIPNVVRSTPQVVQVLSTEDIARTGEGDIAGALQRVTGLSVVGNGFVYVRGLGDRYSSSLLNGSPLPSPEPLRRVVPLDIFPTNIVASALVQKSYSANYAGEFGGGVINLTTRAVPEESFLQVGGSVAFDTVTTSELGYVYDGGSADVFGYDDGERTVPGFIKDAGNAGTNVTDPTLIGQLSNAPTTLLESNFHIPANWSGELSGGTSFDIGDSSRLGFIAAGGLSNSWRTRDAIQQTSVSADGQIARDFRTVLTDNRLLVNGLLGTGLEFGEQRIRFTNVYVHDTLKQGRLGAGTGANTPATPDGVQPFIEQNTNWFERQLFTSQLVGEFEFGGFDLDLRGAYANTKRKSPYERFFRYTYNVLVGDYTNNLTNNSATVAFSDLNEDIWSGNADVSDEFDFGRPVTLSAGYAYTDTDRQSSFFSFQYLANNLDLAQQQLRPDYLLSDFSIQQNGIVLSNTSTFGGAAGNAPLYEAELTVNAGYVQAEAELLDGVRLTAGVRYEDATETVNPDPTGTGTDITPTSIANDYFLPAATMTWNFAEDMQLRLHGSKTIARPQFRELARQVYRDYESDRLFYGNPNLVDSELINAEARYEWFFGRDQRFTLAGFYKKIDNPIEQIAFLPGGGESIQTGFSNAPEAELYGAEIEAQKYIPLDFLGGDLFATRRLLLLANYTYTQSEIKIGDELVSSPINDTFQAANLLFRDGAPLTGQSDHVVNAQIGIEDTETLSQLTLLFNYASERVTNRGPVADGVRLPDLIETPGIRLDVVARQGFEVGGANFEIKFEGRNLTGTEYRESQTFDDETEVFNNRYRLGRVFSVGISAAL